MNSKSGWKPWKPALRSKSESEGASGPWRPTKRQVLWVIGMVVALLTTALLIVNLPPKIWKGLLEERNLTLIGIGVGVTAIIVLLAIGGTASRWTGFRGKTVWDVLQLLIVPLALVVVGFLFTMQQDIRQQHIEDRRAKQAQKIEDQRAKQAQKIEDQRAEAERELAKQRALDEGLQAYLDQMSHLLLEKDLLGSKESSVVRTLARARTATVIQRLDGPRNQNVIRFLNEAHLIGKGQPSIHLLAEADLQDAGLHNVDLSSTDLSEANLSGANMDGADLYKANLSRATLREVNLSWAYLDNTTNLSGADLTRAELRHAELPGADLRETRLWEADLPDAFLLDANLSGISLVRADLQGAWMEGADLHGATVADTDLSGAFLAQADLREARLRGANLSDASLSNADLRGAHLSKADLRGANLSKADLTGAEGVTNEELERQAASLEGATMPNGQKYEVWIKDKEG